MTYFPRNSQAAAIAFTLVCTAAWGQSAKELSTKPGTPVLLLDLLNSRPDCSSNPGPVAIPVISTSPTNGTVQMQIVMNTVAANEKCAARKIPSVALIYNPNKDFIGSDTVQIEVEFGNQKRAFNYRVTVQPAGDKL